LVPVELQEVVGCRDQAPFRPSGRPASSFEAIDPPVRLDLGEDRLDHALAFRIELASSLGGHDSSHEVVGPAEPGLAWTVAGRVGGDDRDDPALAQRVDVLVRPIAGVGQDDPGPLLDPSIGQLALGGTEERSPTA
jgi:hypothetical protein